MYNANHGNTEREVQSTSPIEPNLKGTKMKPDFMAKMANIIAEVQTRTCINVADVEGLEEILQKAVVSAYYEGYSGGYDEGRDAAEAECRNEAYNYEAAVASSYDSGCLAGYDAGYSDGYDDCHSENYSAV